MADRLKVLISAYACEPGKGSEPEVGWQWAMQMARFHDVTVLTRANNREVIEAELAGRDGPKAEFIYYDLPRVLLNWKRKGLPIALYYLLWQAGARRHIGPLLREFDLVHHVTFNSFRQPGFWWLCPRPVVLGPLGGGQICPWRFLPSFGSQWWKEALRSVSVLASALFPHLYFSFACASAILVANQDTGRRIPFFFRHKMVSLLETGVPPGQIRSPRETQASSEIRFIWISRLEKIKACGLAIEAFAVAFKTGTHLRLSIVGNGPEASFVRQLARKLGVGQSITFHGKVARPRIPELLREHDAFIFTSVRDTSGNVLLEAMAAGLPAITLNHHGAAEISSEDTAIRIQPAGFEETRAGLAGAMLRLAGSADLRRALGEAALKRIKEVYLWDRKGEQMNGIYRKAAKGLHRDSVEMPD